MHWVVYNIPGTATGLPENLPIDPAAPMPAAIAGTVQGLSGFKRPIYRGPAPPPGKPHHYHFTVYALDVAGLAPGLTKAQLVEAMQGHIVGQGELVATLRAQAADAAARTLRTSMADTPLSQTRSAEARRRGWRRGGGTRHDDVGRGAAPAGALLPASRCAR